MTLTTNGMARVRLSDPVMPGFKTCRGGADTPSEMGTRSDRLKALSLLLVFLAGLPLGFFLLIHAPTTTYETQGVSSSPQCNRPFELAWRGPIDDDQLLTALISYDREHPDGYVRDGHICIVDTTRNLALGLGLWGAAVAAFIARRRMFRRLRAAQTSAATAESLN